MKLTILKTNRSYSLRLESIKIEYLSYYELKVKKVSK